MDNQETCHSDYKNTTLGHSEIDLSSFQDTLEDVESRGPNTEVQHAGVQSPPFFGRCELQDLAINEYCGFANDHNQMQTDMSSRGIVSKDPYGNLFIQPYPPYYVDIRSCVSNAIWSQSSNISVGEHEPIRACISYSPPTTVHSVHSKFSDERTSPEKVWENSDAMLDEPIFEDNNNKVTPNLCDKKRAKDASVAKVTQKTRLTKVARRQKSGKPLLKIDSWNDHCKDRVREYSDVLLGCHAYNKKECHYNESVGSEQTKKDRKKKSDKHRNKKNEGSRGISDLYKTELCENWMNEGHCSYGDKCNFAHGIEDMRHRIRVANYKTQPCCDPARNDSKLCTFGKRCNYAHPGEPLRCSMPTDYHDKQYFSHIKKEFQELYPFGIYI
ncbi:hypothetical protein RFI_30938 [Reticulomyxa filosa]|uniref:C3H1-type domain-containing protein n=1 Tax=Reticulomyxa filosa TaxID=46433 RepID=X6LX02_RETFI|nr:hypothetical protein RFI_30938 [Reticulomyxa filosa]|eukprot:ETO06453.1 hypothetical protein RFI_30938 [Reticulomyxa filosa]